MSTLLDVMHPDGIARRPLVVGGNCPIMLLPGTIGEPGGCADLIILAPTVAETRSRGWLDHAVMTIARDLAADGIVYVLATPRWRRRIAVMLRARGLRADLAMIHVPDRNQNRYLVPLQPVLAQYAVSHLIPMRGWKRRLASLAIRLPGLTPLVSAALPSVGVVARRPNARPVFSWLAKLCDTTAPPGGVILTPSWRGPRGSLVLHSFSTRGKAPSTIIKIRLSTEDPHEYAREAANLAAIGPGARRAGACIPTPIALQAIESRPLFAQTPVKGRLASALLEDRPQRLSRVMERIASWIERWNAETLTVKVLSLDDLDRLLVEPASHLAPLLDEGAAYLDWITDRCAATAGIAAPLVATHNDLTMVNVLFDERGQLAVVDWETAREHDLPLMDLLYSMTDAIGAARHCNDRLAAFLRGFGSQGMSGQAAAELSGRAMRRLGLGEELAELCVHACWLRHAANEQRVMMAGDPQPFLQIVQWLAWNRPKMALRGLIAPDHSCLAGAAHSPEHNAR